MSNHDIWKKIVEVHNEAKTLFLLAQELEQDDFLEYIQPIKEHRDAYEHVVRALANRLSFEAQEPSEEYQRDSLKKALGHEYRAFFDSADWLSVLLREQITNTLNGYSRDCIDTVLPNYPSEIRIRVTEISEQVAKKRERKDISNADEILTEVREYGQIVGELRDIHKQVTRAIPSLEERRKAERKEGSRGWWLSIAGMALVAVLTHVITVLTTGAAGPTEETVVEAGETGLNLASQDQQAPIPPAPGSELGTLATPPTSAPGSNSRD